VNLWLIGRGSFAKKLPGNRQSIDRTGNQLYGEENHEDHEPDGTVNIEQLQLLENRGHAGAETAGKQLCRFLLRDQRTQDKFLSI
jgi:hypothetical protein